MNPFTNKRLVRTRVGLDWDDLNPVRHIVNAAEAIEDVATSIIDRIPGSEWVKGAVNTVTGPLGDFAKGPFRDFSRSALGETVIRAFSISVSMATAGLAPSIAGIVFPWVGFAVSFAAWSIPGLARGEAFDDALIQEFVYRVSECARILGSKFGDAVAQKLGPLMGEQLTRALQEAKKQLDAGQVLNPQSLAKKLGIRDDVAAYAISWVKRQGEEALRSIKFGYDPETGKKLMTTQSKVSTMASDQYQFSSFRKPAANAKTTAASDQFQFSSLPQYQAAFQPGGDFAEGGDPNASEGSSSKTKLIVAAVAGVALLGAAGWYFMKRRSYR